MAQGLFAGCTDYKSQSLKDIQEDIEHWQKYSEKTKKEFEQIICALKESGYWEKNIPLEFRSFCAEVVHICDTFYHDFGLVLASISKDKITKREISILQNIYQVAHDAEKECPRAYRTGGSRWHQYGDETFAKVEELYAHGRDFFVTLFDVGNIVYRLEHYVKEEVVVDRSIHAENSVVIGDENYITNSNLNANNSSKSKMKWLTEHLWLPLLVAVVSGLIIWIVTK